MHQSDTHRADATAYEQGRGLYLPVALKSLPWAAWVFIALAVGDLAWFIANAGLVSTASLADFGTYALRVIASVSAILLPAALLARHPEATKRAPAVLLGTILYALVQGLLILSQPLQEVFERMTPAGDELPGLIPLAAIYDGLIGAVGAIGVLLLAVGLSAVRRLEDRSGGLTSFMVPVAAILATMVGVAEVSRIDLRGVSLSPTLALYLGSTVLLSILPVVVWAYLTTVGMRGWQAREHPIRGWRLLVIAGLLILVALAFVNISGVVEVQDEIQFRLYGYAIAITYALGHVGLLMAFLVGLPSLDDDEIEYERG